MFAALITVAALSGAISGEAIVAYEAYQGQYSSMSASAGGAGFHYQSCGGTLSHGGAPRYLVNTVWGSAYLPNGYLATELAAFDENCTQTIMLTNTGNFRFSIPEWSRDGSMLAVYAEEWDLNAGVEIGRGIYLADVVYTAGVPSSATNLRLAVGLDGEKTFDWSPDGTKIAFSHYGAAGKRDIYVYTLASNTAVNVTNTASYDEDFPSYTFGRIAFARPNNAFRVSSQRTDIFSIQEAGGSEIQVTNKANIGTTWNSVPCYSPDGQNISFLSGEQTGYRALYRIPANGSVKAVKIYGGRNTRFGYHTWRQ